MTGCVTSSPAKPPGKVNGLGSPGAVGCPSPPGSFDCGKPTLNDWLLRHARQAQGSGSAKTFVACEDNRVAGYFSLTVGQVDSLDAPERFRKGMGQYPIPVVILARLAVNRPDQGRGIGVGLLKDAIRRTLLIVDQAGIHAMLTHPLDEEASRFYRRFGFEPSPCENSNFCCYSKTHVAGLRNVLLMPLARWKISQQTLGRERGMSVVGLC